MAVDNGMLNLDYSINPAWLKQEFHKEDLIIRADPKNQTPGIMGRKLRREWLGDLLVATGHTVDFKTGKIKFTRRPK